tara:strand:+ start:992 stop:2011 length:1020 start_codon:yes stop_codon:yes gene_type:complete
MSQFHQLKVNKINKVTDKAVEILFEIPENLRSEFKFTAGQYITISTNLNNEEVRRAYSLCSDPSSGEIAVGVKRVERGIMSTFLTQELKVGDTLDVMTPKGTFCLTNERKVVGICAGSGITPILSMIKSDSADFTLIYGNKTQASSMFLEEINNMNISKYLTYSREKVDGYLNSRIDNKLLEELSKNESFLNADGYFICGPGEMIDFVEEFLLEKGVDKTKIHFERFTPIKKIVSDNSSIDENTEIISNVTVIMDGDEFEYQLSSKGESILDSAMDAGADVPFSCKGGVCCTCKAKVIEGKAIMTENYALSEEEVAEGFILTCKSHPDTENIVVDFDEI